MLRRGRNFLLSSVAAAVTLAPLAFGQAAAPASRPAPRTVDGKPDLNGLWGTDCNFYLDITKASKKGETLRLQAWAEKVTRERLSKDDPEANCLPAGVPRMTPYPWRIVQQPNYIFFLFEGNIHSYRQIFMDGR